MDADGDAAVAAAHRMRLAAVGVRIVRALSDAEIPSLILKGMALATWLYPDDPRSRVSRDVDVLVPPDKVDAAERVLAEVGLVHEPLDDLLLAPAWHAHEWRSPEGVSIDLHRSLVGVRRSSLVWSVFCRDARSLDTAAGRISVPPVTCLALHVALHAAQNGPDDEKSIRDLRRALQVASDDVWAGAYRAAEELDASDAFIAGLGLEPAGRAAMARLGIDATAPSGEVAIRVNGGGAQAIGLYHLLAQPSAWATARAVVARVFPPPEFVRPWIRSVRQGRSLPIAVAYLYRWWWLLRGLAPAAKALRSALRDPRAGGDG